MRIISILGIALLGSPLAFADVSFYPYTVSREVLLEVDAVPKETKEKEFFNHCCSRKEKPLAISNFKFNIESVPAFLTPIRKGKWVIDAKKGTSSSDETSVRVRSRSIKIEYRMTFD